MPLLALRSETRVGTKTDDGCSGNRDQGFQEGSQTGDVLAAGLGLAQSRTDLREGNARIAPLERCDG